MTMIKGIYHNGIIEPIEKLKNKDLSEVIIIFPDSTKSVKKISGLFKDYNIDFNEVAKELKLLNKNSKDNLLEKFDE